MKQQFPFQFLLLGLLLAGLWGCSDETDLPGTGSDNDGQGTFLTVSVTDGGYISSAGEESTTRVQEEDYKTVFTAGDKIGLYAVKNGAILPGHDNLCLTLAADGKWAPPADVTLAYEGASATYYAYYPYQTDMTDKVTVTATTADSFFKPLVDGWTPASDQGNYAKYTAQDLMTGKGSISDNPGNTRTLTVSLSHRMALAVIKTSCTIYEFTNASLPNYIVPVMNNLMFEDYLPCLMVDDGTRRFLVKTGSTISIKGNYTDAKTSKKRVFEFKPTISNGGNYKVYNVDNAVITRKTHTLKSGDFFMQDGSLVAGDQTLTSEEQANCIGIIYKVGTGARDNINYYGDKLTAIHGYVVALQQSSQVWGDASRVFGIGDTTLSEEGYKSTQMIMTAATNESKKFPACFYCVNYTPASTGITSGWYFPTYLQMKNFAKAGSVTTFNAQLAKISGATVLSGTYHTSSEFTDQLWGITVGNVKFDYFKKNSTRNVRAVLTF